MRTTALVLSVLALGSMAVLFRRELRCLWIGRHDWYRPWPMGGQKCHRCAATAADVEEAYR